MRARPGRERDLHMCIPTSSLTRSATRATLTGALASPRTRARRGSRPHSEIGEKGACRAIADGPPPSPLPFVRSEATVSPSLVLAFLAEELRGR
jgi:hypothetical protein